MAKRKFMMAILLGLTLLITFLSLGTTLYEDLTRGQIGDILYDLRDIIDYEQTVDEAVA